MYNVYGCVQFRLGQTYYLCFLFKNQAMNPPIETRITSETGQLEAVLMHRPGPEVENMTPGNAERALYNDILNLSIATTEYDQLQGVLEKVSRVLEISDLLSDILEIQDVRTTLLHDICCNEQICSAAEWLSFLPSGELARQLIEGVPLEKDNLTRYLSEERYLLRPLHNLFFTRDAAMGYNQHMFIGKMANRVRERESLIVEAILRHHPYIDTTSLNPTLALPTPGFNPPVTLEGGDFQVVREDVLLIGTGLRTSTSGIDYVISKLCSETKEARHIIVQELPAFPESFIHLDMVFTVLDRDACMVYAPIVYELNRYRTIHVELDNGRVKRISQEENIPQALKKLGISLQAVSCGGQADTWIQEREQWHSGANFFSFAPGKIIGYERNVHTLNELSRHGFEVISATEVMAGVKHPGEYNRCVVTIEGSELARGGGGARCMTLPLRRGLLS